MTAPVAYKDAQDAHETHRARQAHINALRRRWVGDTELTAEQLEALSRERKAETCERRPEWFS